MIMLEQLKYLDYQMMQQILLLHSSYNIELVEAYPSAVGEVALGHSMGNEVLKLSVTFKYRRWKNDSLVV